MTGMVLGMVTVLLLAWLLYRRGVHAAAAPVGAMCLVMVTLLLAGVLNLLQGVTIALQLLIPAAAAFTFFRTGRQLNQPGREPFFHAGVLLFVLGGAAVCVLFAVRQPILSGWDDYSYWAMARRVTAESDRLYCSADSPLRGSCMGGAVVVLDYFFQHWGSFAEWRAIAVLDLLQLACVAAVTGAVPEKRKHLAPAVGLTGFLLTFLLTNYTVYAHTAQQAGTYLGLYLDLPVGLMAAVPLLLWAAQRHGEKPCTGLMIAELFCLPMVKDVGMALGMVSAAVVFVLYLLDTAGQWKHCRRQLVLHGAAILSPAAGYAIWNGFWMLWSRMHLTAPAVQGPAAAPRDPLDASFFGALQQLVSPSIRTEKGQAVLSGMADAFVHVKICYFGTPLLLCLLFLGIAAVLIALAADKKARLRLLAGSGLLFLGLLAYQIFLALCYIVIFSEGEGRGLASYNRYVFSYFILWGLALLALFAGLQLRRPAIGGLALTAAACVMLAVFARCITVERTFLNYQPNAMTAYRQTKETTRWLFDALPDGKNTVFLVDQGGDGFPWLEYRYEIWPRGDVDVYGSGLTIAEKAEDVPEGCPWTLFSRAAWEELLLKSCDYVYVRQADGPFAASYGGLFEGEIQAGALYEVTQAASGVKLVCREVYGQ